MARSVILGNGSLTIGLDESGYVHDFYFPYVGLENLTTSRSQPHYIGISVDGDFSWLHDKQWEKEVDFRNDALISTITYTNKDLGIRLFAEDFVDHHYDVFCRNVTIDNLYETSREIKLFFHQVFQISALGRADTVMYVPEGHYILDYKGRCSLLAYAESDDGIPFDQYAAGNAGIEGKEGTFRDAEDGELSMSAVEHGGVDSTIRCTITVAGNDTRSVHYWIAAGNSQSDLQKLHARFVSGGAVERLTSTKQHWANWLETAKSNIPKMDKMYTDALMKSLMILRVHADKRGGIIASADSSIYNYGRDYYSYVWPRDGAYAIWPLIKLGYTVEAKRFFQFCAHIMHKDGYMMHKYQSDSAIGSTWHPLLHDNHAELAIQEDETAILLFMLGEYEKNTGDTQFIDSLYETLIVPAAEFMSRYIDEETNLPHASYDLWEEKFLTSTYTTALVTNALHYAASIAERHNDSRAVKWFTTATVLKSRYDAFYNDATDRYVKGFFAGEKTLFVDDTLDVSSFYAVWKYEYSSNATHIKAMLEQIENTLLNVSPSGGAARYENDAYFRSTPSFKGNPWFVTTLWLAQYYAANSERNKAIQLLHWSLEHRLPSGVLSEQVNPTTGEAVSVTPLVWSHAELINTILDLYL